jgi:hypothetical protein
LTMIMEISIFFSSPSFARKGLGKGYTIAN